MFFVQQLQVWKMVMFFLVICSVWAVIENKALSQTSNQDLIEALKATWKAQESEIATANIRYRSVVSGPSRVEKLTPGDVRKIVSDLMAHPGDFASIVLRFHNPAARKKLEALKDLGDIKEFKVEDSKVREDWHVSAGTSTRVLDGEQEVITRPANHQIDLVAAGQSRIVSSKLKDFRLIPYLPSAEACHLKERSNSQVVFSCSSNTKDKQTLVQEFDVDETTGMVNRFSRSNGEGQVHNEIFQSGFVTYPGGIVFPTIVVATKYLRGELYSLDIKVIEEAHFNEELNADTFTVNAPAGTNVFDYRKDPNDPLFVKTKTAIPDIVTEVNQATDISANKKGPHYFRWLVIAVGIGLILIGLTRILYRRRVSRTE